MDIINNLIQKITGEGTQTINLVIILVAVAFTVLPFIKGVKALGSGPDWKTFGKTALAIVAIWMFAGIAMVGLRSFGGKTGDSLNQMLNTSFIGLAVLGQAGWYKLKQVSEKAKV